MELSKQGCVLASTLFSMMFSAMLTDAFQDGDNGIPIRYRFDGKLFNLRRLQAKSKVQTEVLDEFLFVVDMAKGAPIEEKMQKGVDQVSDSCDSYDLTISIKKTEVVYQGFWSTRTLVNSYLSQPVPTFGQLVPYSTRTLVNSYPFFQNHAYFGLSYLSI